MTAYRPTIGLEVHAELNTKTKMFCRSINDPDETRSNANVCPICVAHPGTLPVINHEAVRQVLRVGAAVSGTLADFSEFDRKSYFYPDIPKGYQISQYIHPLVTGGSLAGIAITRVHLEEDTARSVHADGKSLVDFNRAGVPLMELVTEPVIADAETAGKFARELQLLLRTLGASDANLEKGQMRIEANISISKTDTYGTKVEIKNLNSFRSAERAIAFEIERQTKLLEQSGSVVQETRGWNESTQETFHQRFKEGSADYRYFPEPDLPKIFFSEIPEFSLESIHASLPELPWERRTRYIEQYALRESDVAYLCATLERANFFDAVAAQLGDNATLLSLAANYIVSDLANITKSQSDDALAYKTLDPHAFAKLITLTSAGTLSSRGAKDVLVLLIEKGGDPEALARGSGLIQIHDETVLSMAIDRVLHTEQTAVQEYKNGKKTILQYLIGKTMKESRGAGNPELIRKILTGKLS